MFLLHPVIFLETSIDMQEPSLAFLRTLLETPSPSGFEQQIQDVVRDWAKHYADEVRTDRHGNVIAVAAIPGGASPRDHARRPLRPDRPHGPAHRRQRLPLRPAHRRLGHADPPRPVPDRLGQRRARSRRRRPARPRTC